MDVVLAVLTLPFSVALSIIIFLVPIILIILQCVLVLLLYFLFALLGLLIALLLDGYVFFACLILMRTSHNEMPKGYWVTLWVSFAAALPLLLYPRFTQLHLPALAIFVLALVRWFGIHPDAHGVFYEMPTPVYWVLIGLVLPSLFIGVNTGNITLVALILYNSHLHHDGIHNPGVVISWWVVMGIVAGTLVASNAYFSPKYVHVCLLYFGAVGALHKQMWPANKHFGWLWALAWFLLLHVFYSVFRPDMPPIWYALISAAVVGLGFAIRPDTTLARFYAWTISVFFIRQACFLFYMYYIKGSSAMKARLFPYFLFSDAWRRSKPRGSPPPRRIDPEPSGLTASKLCICCFEITKGSALIMGSSFALTRLAEWHEFYPAAEFANDRGDGESESTAFSRKYTSCHLCCLIWHSMSTECQKELSGAPRGDSDAKLIIKI